MQVILEVGWSYASDLWSAGCIIAELYTGDLFFATVRVESRGWSPGLGEQVLANSLPWLIPECGSHMAPSAHIAWVYGL